MVDPDARAQMRECVSRTCLSQSVTTMNATSTHGRTRAQRRYRQYESLWNALRDFARGGESSLPGDIYWAIDCYPTLAEPPLTQSHRSLDVARPIESYCLAWATSSGVKFQLRSVSSRASGGRGNRVVALMLLLLVNGPVLSR